MSQPPSQSSSLTETGAVRKDGVLPADELAEEATEGVTAGGEGSGSLGEEDSGDGAYTAATTDDGGCSVGVAQPTRDTLAEGLVGLVRPSLESLDESVAATREAQAQLKDKIQSLENQLVQLQASVNRNQSGVDLEAYINKLTSSKKRILVVNSILQGAQDRLNKVHQNCLKETTRRKPLLEPATSTREVDELTVATSSMSTK